MACGSVFDRFCLKALKIAENTEKTKFYVFAFLPPYIGASGLLVSGMRKSEEIYRLVSKILNFMACG